MMSCVHFKCTIDTLIFKADLTSFELPCLSSSHSPFFTSYLGIQHNLGDYDLSQHDAVRNDLSVYEKKSIAPEIRDMKSKDFFDQHLR